MLEMKTYVDIGCTIFTETKPVNNHLKFGWYFEGHSVLGLMLKAVVGAGVAVAFASASAMKDNCLEPQLERLIINPPEALSDHIPDV